MWSYVGSLCHLLKLNIPCFDCIMSIYSGEKKKVTLFQFTTIDEFEKNPHEKEFINNMQWAETFSKATWKISKIKEKNCGTLHMHFNKHATKYASSCLHSYEWITYVQTRGNTWDMAGKMVYSTDKDASISLTSCCVCVSEMSHENCSL